MVILAIDLGALDSTYWAAVVATQPWADAANVEHMPTPEGKYRFTQTCVIDHGCNLLCTQTRVHVFREG